MASEFPNSNIVDSKIRDALENRPTKKYVDDAIDSATESLGGRINSLETNTGNQISNLSNGKADKATTYTKAEVDAAVAAATPSDYDSVKARLATAEGKIPEQATARNQLADKAFVNSSVATATATFRGTSAAATQEAFDVWLAGLAADDNDYVFWRTVDTYGNAVFKRYKYNGETWEWEFDLNNSSFTAEQWAAINSGITSGAVAKLGALPTAAELATALIGKQDVLTFDSGPTAGSSNPARSGGIWSAIWGALAALPTGFSSLYDWCVSKLAEKRDKNDMAVYKKVGVGETWTLIGQDGLTTKNVEGIFTDWGEGIGNWSFFIDGVSVAGTDSYYSQDDYEGVQWVGGDEVGYTGTASRPFVFQPVTGDSLAKTSQIPTTPGAVNAMPATATGADIPVDIDPEAMKISAAILDARQRASVALATASAANNTARSADNNARQALSSIYYHLVIKTIVDNAVTIDIRASNSVTISETLSPNTLAINIPTVTAGNLRDFAIRLNIAAGVTAPEIVWPQGVTLENKAGEFPEIADGGTGGSSTILYFSESENDGTTAKFSVKGETLTAIARA